MVVANHFGKLLSDGLGLPKHLKNVELHFEVDEPVYVGWTESFKPWKEFKYCSWEELNKFAANLYFATLKEAQEAAKERGEHV